MFLGEFGVKFQDVFKCPIHCSSVLDRDSRFRALHQFRELRISMCFSGDCAPTVAIASLDLSFNQFVHGYRTGPTFRYVFACDAGAECRTEPNCLPHPPDTVVDDILRSLTDSAKVEVAALGDSPPKADLSACAA